MSTPPTKIPRSAPAILNFAARVIHRKGKSEHVTQLLTELNWLIAKNMLNLDTACSMYEVAHSKVPANICELFPRVRNKNQRTLRQSDDFYTPHDTNTLAGKRSFSSRGTALWSGLDVLN